MVPVQQVFALVLEKIWLKQNKKIKINSFNKECLKLRKQYPEDDKYKSKIENLKNKEIQNLLFNEFLRETNNCKDKNNMMTKYLSFK
jgi:poly(A) polymerase Pap1